MGKTSDRRCWVITGGCGFIGVNLIHRLLQEQQNIYIRVLDNLSVGSREALHSVCEFTEFRNQRSVNGEFINDGLVKSAAAKGESDANLKCNQESLSYSVELVVGDILNFNLVQEVCDGADVLVHLAANTGVLPSIEDPRGDCRTNVMGTLNCLEAARQAGVQRFIFASSGAPLGQQNPPIHENMVPKPLSPYGASKMAGEGYCFAYDAAFGLETVALRFGNVYGPRSNHKGSVVAKFIRLLMLQESLPIYGDGRQTRDLIFIDDLVQAIELAATVHRIGGEVFQIATHREHTIIEVAEALNQLAQKHMGYTVPLAFEKEKRGEIRKNYSDISKCKAILGFEPKVHLLEGLELTLKWFLTCTM